MHIELSYMEDATPVPIPYSKDWSELFLQDLIKQVKMMIFMAFLITKEYL